MSTNDSLSNAIGPISISLKMTYPLDAFMKFWNRCISELFEIQTKVREVQTGTNDSLSNGINEIKKS